MTRTWFARIAAVAVLAITMDAAEVFGSIGWRDTGDDEGSIGKGAQGRFGVGWRWSRKAGLEGEFGLSRNRREIAADSIFSGRSHDVSLSVVKHFGNDRVEPYILGGAGVVHFTNTSPFLQRNLSATGYQLHVAFGLKGWVSKRVYIRPEARISAGRGGGLARAVEPPLWGGILSIGAGYRW